MTDDYLAVDTGALAKAVPPTRQLAEHVLNVKSSALGRLNELGEPWGDDVFGQQFLEQYLGPASNLLDGFESVFEALSSMADGVDTMHKGLTRTEQQNAEVAEALRMHVRSESGTEGGSSHGGRHGS
jgi:hypothetical protein